MACGFRLPHVRGGVSSWTTRSGPAQRSSPRPWGCFSGARLLSGATGVFPTSVGVFPRARGSAGARSCLPHVRGGVSRLGWTVGPWCESSPRPWGCFQGGVSGLGHQGVFPTSVGVFLLKKLEELLLSGLPHVRGGVSGPSTTIEDLARSSPRPWGCFWTEQIDALAPDVFPTSVGVFLHDPHVSHVRTGLPHVRGGVSASAGCDSPPSGSSPRPWGCFFASAGTAAGAVVFPTSVGVFPASPVYSSAVEGLPHVRGGVSPLYKVHRLFIESSPRPWGCFYRIESCFHKA